MGFLVSILVLSFLVFFHELGHFLAARAFGVRVEVFSIGFGKKLFGFKKGMEEVHEKYIAIAVVRYLYYSSKSSRRVPVCIDYSRNKTIG